MKNVTEYAEGEEYADATADAVEDDSMSFLHQDPQASTVLSVFRAEVCNLPPYGFVGMW